MLKKISLLLISFTLSFTFICRADEGMWLPILLKQLNEADMKSKGLKLSAEDIYNVNKSSLKDAVVHFGGGCTGEIISSEGLLLTNHHCGYGQIQSHSSVKNDYLTNGFWAMNRAEELSNPGLTATFIIRMEDVTSKILEGVNAGMNETLRDSVINQNIKKLEKSATEGTHYEAKIKPFYYGNEYYMFITETFKDVRMVGAPPSSIGKFGGDTDNWMWPRHTGDFSLFRIYAGKDNKPAEYSIDNVPFKPRYSFPISLKGTEQGDFTMVFGFPGRTTEYLTSYAVEMIMKVSNPAKIKIRDKRLAIWDADMKASDEVRIKYAAKYASVSNYHKKWIGENRGLKKLDAIEKKRAFEDTFSERIANDPEKTKHYGALLPEFKKLYEKMDQPQRSYDYFVETAMAVELIRYANNYMAIVELSKNENVDKKELEKALENLKTASKGHFKDYNAPTDKKIFAALLKMYYDDIDKSKHPGIFKIVETKYKGDFECYADEVFKKSFMASEEKANAFIAKEQSTFASNKCYSKSGIKKIMKDPAYKLMLSIYSNYRENILPEYIALNKEVNFLTRTYMRALREVITEKNITPMPIPLFALLTAKLIVMNLAMP